MLLSATVTENQEILSCTGMVETIVDLERRFFDTNGVRVVVDAKVVDKDRFQKNVKHLLKHSVDTVLPIRTMPSKRVTNHL